MSKLNFLEMNDVLAHYTRRHALGRTLTGFLNNSDSKKFAELALGISDSEGNYSAAEHGLGPQILAMTKASMILDLGKRLANCADPKRVVDEIYSARIPNLKISVGSEIAMMLCPDRFWVANTRSIWAHLLVKHDFDYAKANEELRLYRDPERTSEMDYRLWKAIYLVMQPNLLALGRMGDDEASAQGVRSGKEKNLWYDAIANAIYQKRSYQK
jgi:hypothetical protein